MFDGMPALNAPSEVAKRFPQLPEAVAAQAKVAALVEEHQAVSESARAKRRSAVPAGQEAARDAQASALAEKANSLLPLIRAAAIERDKLLAPWIKSVDDVLIEYRRQAVLVLRRNLGAALTDDGTDIKIEASKIPADSLPVVRVMLAYLSQIELERGRIEGSAKAPWMREDEWPLTTQAWRSVAWRLTRHRG